MKKTTHFMRVALQSRATLKVSFTLIELLVVIAILAILAVAVVLVLNPVELIKESRDTTRLTDLANLHQGLTLLQTDQPNAAFGSSTTVYVSIPWTTTSSNCSNLGLPTLPSGYAYGCAPTSTYQHTDGTGWIPVDFTSFSAGAPFSKLPVDPTNATSTGLYYTYIPGGSWEMTALMESTKRRLGGDKDVVGNDGGDTYSTYEVGSSLTDNPVNDDGLVGYWKLDEGSGSFADSSGNGNAGTQSGGVTYGQTGKAGKAVSFDGSNDYIDTNSVFSNALSTFTYSLWVKPGASQNSYAGVFGNHKVGNDGATFRQASTALNEYHLVIGDGLVWYTITPNASLTANTWSFVTIVKSSSEVIMYVNGVEEASKNMETDESPSSQNLYIARNAADGVYWKGAVDEFRIYNRALSVAEISAIYNAIK